MMKHIVITLTLLLAATASRAQMPAPVATEDVLFSPFHLGVRLGYLRNQHATNADIFVGCPECGTFQNGQGSGYDMSILGELPLSFFHKLELTFSAGFAERGGAFGEAATGLLPILDPASGKYVTLTRQNDYTASLKYVTLTAGLRIRPIKKYPAYFTAEFESGLPLASATNYTQTERILAPDGVRYPDTHTLSRTVGTGQIQGVGTAFGAQGTIGYEFPLSFMLTAAPEISYYYPRTSVEPAFRWRVSSIRAGVAVRYNLLKKFEEPPPKAAPPPVVEKPVIRVEKPSIEIASLAPENLKIVETVVTETFPILPYIFFDSASAELPERFVRYSPMGRAAFKESNLPHRALGSYYEILNVIGARMQATPNATLTVNGTTDGKEINTSAANALATSRAEHIARYLQDVWQIDSARLIVTTSDAPHNPSSTEYAEGYEENRRVELSSNDDKLLKPIVHERFREESATPTILPVSLGASSAFVPRSWKLDVAVHSTPIYSTSGSGAPPASVAWRPAPAQLDSVAKYVSADPAIAAKDSLDWTFSMIAMNGASAVKTIRTAVEKRINPYELSRLSLIVFDFDQSRIDAQNRRMISQFAAKSLYPQSTATIVGSTDNLGELAHNQQLSQDRANNVHDLVVAEKPDAKILSTKGIGPSQLLYDNSLPEGRYYCRTVKVEVETPLESIIGR